ncbi:Pr6Pr family membrane protein [Streptomyces ziwulingensis]|uniref:Pr6Pr family membrane protein n=1 Tax=Streptomyces ziwulingensis TaxID=1045501 RepID=A0ABP9BLX0_9ACTN
MTAPIPRDIPDLPAVPGPPSLLPAPVPATAVVTPVRHPLTAGFRLLAAVLAIAGVVSALTSGDPLTRTLSHFSTLSALLLAAVLTLSARRAWTARRPLPSAVTGAALLYVVASCLVHHLVLTNTGSPLPTAGSPTGRPALTHHLLDTAVPLAAVADWLFLTAPGRLHLRQATGWLLLPLAYLTFSVTRGDLLPPDSTALFLHPSLDSDQHGYKAVLGNTLLTGLACYALAVLLVALDHTRPNPLRRPC